MSKQLIREVKLSPKEKIVMDSIEKTGEYIWDSFTEPQMEKTLKDLMWKEFIERKKKNGLNVNVFIGGFQSQLLFMNNNAAKILNS